MKVKIQVIPPGVTTNPEQGLLLNEKIHTSDVKESMRLLENLYVIPEVVRIKTLPYCSCRNGKISKATKMVITNVDSEGLCCDCGHNVVWLDSDTDKKWK